MKYYSYQSFLDSTVSYRKTLGKNISGVILYAGIVFFSVFILDLGFQQNAKEEAFLFAFYHSIKWILVAAFSVRNILNVFNADKSRKIKAFDAIIISILLLTFRVQQPDSFLGSIKEFLPSYKYLYTPIFAFIFIAEYSRNAVSYYSRRLNPYLIMVFSFVAIILLGSVLLSLPNSTSKTIPLTDIIFTATTAVCVTGFSVISIAHDLTLLGQIIILVLMQIGGLGILTFASFIGFLISGKNVSFQQRLVLRELANTQQMNDVIHAVYKIVSIMIIVEVVGAVLIYYATPASIFTSQFEHVFFAVFHSVSAFCNAGLSNYPEGLRHVDLSHQPFLLLHLSFLIIIGGIGFPIMLNLYEYVKQWVRNIWNFFRYQERFNHRPYLIHVNSRIIFFTTLILLFVGTVGVFTFEYNRTLSGLDFIDKIIAAFFTSVTTRTAGFGLVDFSAIGFSTYVLVIFLMWVGASPGGTGGGVKTTTFSVMVMNFWSLAQGKSHLVIQNRRISDESINKSFAIILASFLWIGLAVFLIISFDSQFSLEQIVFEAFSAFSTTGLTQGITKELSDSSKFVLILLMLIGRVGSIAFLSAFFYRVNYSKIQYPHQDLQL